MFQTERLLLRPFLTTDIPTIYQLVYADPLVRVAWSSFEGSLEVFERRFHTDKNWHIVDGFGYWAITRSADQQLLGLMGFQNHADEDTSWLVLPDGSRTVGHVPGRLDAELTYALGHASWGSGYATEAGQTVLAYGFQELGIDQVINAISPSNRQSRWLMERLGFTFVDNGNPADLIGIRANPNQI